MLKKIQIETRDRIQMINVNKQIVEIVQDSGVRSGLCILYVPHTTASIAINENTDANVQGDLMSFLTKMAPANATYKHMAGNADSHIEASVIGCTTILIIEDGELILGTWQAIFFCEFDGPRSRQLYVKVIEDK